MTTWALSELELDEHRHRPGMSLIMFELYCSLGLELITLGWAQV